MQENDYFLALYTLSAYNWHYHDALGGAAMRLSVEERWKRFNTKWRLDPQTGCHVWTGAKRYGSHRWVDGKVRAVHHIAWLHLRGPIPEGLWVLHRCDNPPCVNIEHLFLGTPSDNTVDAVQKGRWIGPRKLQKLSDEQARSVVKRVADGESQASVARSLGVSRACICLIVSGRKRAKATGVALEDP